MSGYVFNAPPGWPVPAGGLGPPDGWTPDPTWPPAPAGWKFWSPRRPRRPAPAARPQLAADVPSEPPPARSRDASAELMPRWSMQTDDDDLKRRIAELEAEVAASRGRRRISARVELDDERVLQEVGIYRYHHPLENAAAYKDGYDSVSEIKEMVKAATPSWPRTCSRSTTRWPRAAR